MKVEDGIYLGDTGSPRTPAFIIPSANTSYKLTGKGRLVDQTLDLARRARKRALIRRMAGR